MTFSKKLMKLFVLHILSSCLYSFGQGQVNEFEILRKLTAVSQFTPILVPKSNLSTSVKCSDDLKHLFDNLKSPWALQMLDSAGKVTSGILRGSVSFRGQYTECLNVYSPLDEKGHGGFHGRYCLSTWTINEEKFSFVRFQFGLCVPDSCSGKNIETLFRRVLRLTDYFPRRLKIPKSYFNLKQVVCTSRDRPLDSPSIIYLCIVSIFISITVAGSLLTAFHYFKTTYVSRRKSLNEIKAECSGKLEDQNGESLRCGKLEEKTSSVSRRKSLNEIQTECSGKLEDQNGESTRCEKIEEKTSDKPYVTHKSASVWEKFLLCFSVIESSRKIFNLERTDDQLLIIHGIKVLTISWVLLGHTYLRSTAVMSNILDAVKSLDHRIFELIRQATFSVDVFFLLSGFLVSYIYLREAPKRKIRWIFFYLHRLWRLTPPYLASTFFFMFVFKYIGSGPFWDENTCDEQRSSWWKYLLYLNNFIPSQDFCAEWTWYIGSEVQFYAISPLFLYPLSKRPKTGFFVLGSLLFASWFITGVISYTYDALPLGTGLSLDQEDYTKLLKRYMTTHDAVYTKPYCRIGPYIIGIMLGYILHKTAGKKNFLNWRQQVLGWFVAFCCLLIPIFGHFHVEMTMAICLLHNVFARTFFSVGLAWVIYACSTGHGGFLTKVLSWRLLIPLSRLTFGVYLTHAMVLSGIWTSVLTPVAYTHILWVIFYIATLVLCFAVAFVFCLLFEYPFLNLESLLLREKQIIKGKQW